MKFIFLCRRWYENNQSLIQILIPARSSEWAIVSGTPAAALETATAPNQRSFQRQSLLNDKSRTYNFSIRRKVWHARIWTAWLRNVTAVSLSVKTLRNWCCIEDLNTWIKSIPADSTKVTCADSKPPAGTNMRMMISWPLLRGLWLRLRGQWLLTKPQWIFRRSRKHFLQT